jgi:hypothetical protein
MHLHPDNSSSSNQPICVSPSCFAVLVLTSAPMGSCSSSASCCLLPSIAAGSTSGTPDPGCHPTRALAGGTLCLLAGGKSLTNYVEEAAGTPCTRDYGTTNGWLTKGCNRLTLGQCVQCSPAQSESSAERPTPFVPALLPAQSTLTSFAAVVAPFLRVMTLAGLAGWRWWRAGRRGAMPPAHPRVLPAAPNVVAKAPLETPPAH